MSYYIIANKTDRKKNSIQFWNMEKSNKRYFYFSKQKKTPCSKCEFPVTCLRDGIEVQKSTVECEVKSGCRLIQKTGQCCPEYQCGTISC